MSGPTDRRLHACVIGAGPRGLSVLERLCANARDLAPDAAVHIHVVDPHPPGPGAVWRTDQSGHLLMNTVASQVTMFADDSVDMLGPVVSGPSLSEWATLLALLGPFGDYADEVLAEARRLTPDSYPTRTLYGAYLGWVFRRVTGAAPEQVEIVVHASAAVRLEDTADGRQTVRLADGTRLEHLDAVVLALGHLRSEPTDEESALAAFAAAHRLTYRGPGNPADEDLSALRPGQAVLLRGLGLNFFDYVALLTLGRGGSFERRAGVLVYRPSGREPLLYAGSRRGVPYSSRGANQKGPHGRHLPVVLTPRVIAGLRSRLDLDFRRDLWPLIAKEVETCYYTTLIRSRTPCGCAARRFQARYLPLRWQDPAEQDVLAAFGVEAHLRWDWDRVTRPWRGQDFPDGRAFRDWLLDHLRRDVEEARDGNVSDPRKAALDVLRDLRNEIRLVVDHGRLTGRSHRDDLEGWYTPLNAYLSIGPPVRRIEELMALIEAGVLTVLGPDTRVRPDSQAGAFVATSAVAGVSVPVTTLLEARLPRPDVRRTTDRLLRHALATGQARAYRIDSYQTGGLEVTERPYHLVDAHGRPHPRRYAYGVPTESVHWVTAAGARPGVNSVMFGDSDAIARALLTVRRRVPLRAGAPVHNPAGEHLVQH
jgi:hypothetical protein